jgi:hypothetical protein
MRQETMKANQPQPNITNVAEKGKQKSTKEVRMTKLQEFLLVIRSFRRNPESSAGVYL